MLFTHACVSMMPLENFLPTLLQEIPLSYCCTQPLSQRIVIIISL